MQKKGLIFALVIVFTIFLVGCSDENFQKDGGSNSTEHTSENDSQTQQTTEENTESEVEKDSESEVNSEVDSEKEAETGTETEKETETEAETEAETEIEKETEKETETESGAGAEVEKDSWVADLEAAKTATQIVIVEASGSSAKVSMFNKTSDGLWEEILTTSANIGRNGIGKTKEGDGKTPRGQYSFTFAFGIKANPGTALSYVQVDDSYYWVDDSDSIYYNQFVSTNDVTKDWTSAEHIVGAGNSYNYVLAINYNSSCTPGVGSAIFMHCTPTGGAGCIAVPESSMKKIIQNVQPGCVLIIDTAENLSKY